MTRLHICNTFFERELSFSKTRSLLEWIRSHPIVLQLQFLPLLYAEPTDWILVSDLPDPPYDPRLHLLDEILPSGIELVDWGPSYAVQQWAKKKNLSYETAPWETVKEINSKVFSFLHSPPLEGACLLHTPEELKSWMDKTYGSKVLKTPFGTAGSGHFLHPRSDHSYPFPLIGEPWVERTLDFSTQWKGGKLYGITAFENGPTGRYLRTYQKPIPSWALEEHLSFAKPLIALLEEKGHRGHVGIDAFIYRWQGKEKLHPIVEINARKTMSWVALQTPYKTLSYLPATTGALPSSLQVLGKKICFSRNLQLF